MGSLPLAASVHLLLVLVVLLLLTWGGLIYHG
jgi:hypothetical protein